MNWKCFLGIHSRIRIDESYRFWVKLTPKILEKIDPTFNFRDFSNKVINDLTTCSECGKQLYKVKS